MSDSVAEHTAVAITIAIEQPTFRVATSSGSPAALAAATAHLRLWLRGQGGRITALRRVAPPSDAALDRTEEDGPQPVRFVAAVAPGSYVVCAAGLGTPFTFPPRSVEVAPDASDWAFQLRYGDQPFFRLGSSLVPFGGYRHGLAAVLLDHDVDPGALDRLTRALAVHHYDRVIDLTAPSSAATAPPTPSPSDALVIEFRARHAYAATAGRLVRSTRHIALQAGLAPCMLRLGCLVSSDYGRVVLDNEFVLGFSDMIGPETAAAHLARTGGRLLEDLSDPAERRLIYVVRFDDAAPDAGLRLTEHWLQHGLLHWVEPNLVEH